MKKIVILVILASLIMAFHYTVKETESSKPLKPAIQNSLDILQKSSHEFIENAQCTSCHGQFLGIVAFSYGREKGFLIQDSILNEAENSILKIAKVRNRDYLEHTEFLGGDISTSYVLWAFGLSKKPADKTTDFMIHLLLERQTKDGHWVGNNSRPPLEYYSFSATAMAVYGINHFSRPGLDDKIKSANQKAIRWMMETSAINNEEKAFQLLGLTWVKSSPLFIQKQAELLMSLQHADGGWSQLDSLPSDAYATGQSLYALEESGHLKITDTAYQKGVEFLLRTQHEDGSWRIISRTHPFLPHVSSGFPYGADQFISAAGTNWATIALLQAYN